MADITPIVLVCPACSAVFVLAEYIPDGATVYKRCIVCRRILKITPDKIEIDDSYTFQDDKPIRI